MLRTILELEDLRCCKHVRIVKVGGESLLKEDRELFYQQMQGRAELENLYGPTEASINVTHWSCGRESESTIVPIGRPISNVKMHILDRWLQAVPVGVNGDLYIGGGVALARGYQNRPELTAEKFIPSPYGGTGERMYWTGDVARYREDGEIEFLGRKDNQVKVRGFRIELGEIEAVLEEHTQVRSAVVGVKGEGGEKRLVGYVVGEGKEIDVSELRRYAGERLPEYMVPNAIVVLEELPLLPNGKVDRRALPDPEWGKLTNVAYEGPQTPVEEALAGIWKEVLRIERVGVHDRFFDLGGHSLLATQVATRIRHAFGIPFSLRSLFEKTTIAELAVLVEEEVIKQITAM